MARLPVIFLEQRLLPKMKIKRTREELKALAKISSNCSLVSLFMSSCNVERTIEASTFKKLRAEVEVNSSFLKIEGELFSAKAILTIRGFPPESEKDPAVKISVEYVLNYKLENAAEFGENELANFCNINVLYNAWPFFREFVLSSTNRMSVPPLVLPLLSVSASPPAKKEKKSDPRTKEGKD